MGFPRPRTLSLRTSLKRDSWEERSDSRPPSEGCEDLDLRHPTAAAALGTPPHIHHL